MKSSTYVPKSWRDATVPNNIRKNLAIHFLMQRSPTLHEQISAYLFFKSSTDIQTAYDIYDVLVDRTAEKYDPLHPIVQKQLTQYANALLGIIDCNKAAALKLLLSEAPTKCEQVVACMLIRTVSDRQTGHDIYGILVDQREVLKSAVKKKLRVHADHALDISFPMIKESERYQIKSKKKKKAA